MRPVLSCLLTLFCRLQSCPCFCFRIIALACSNPPQSASDRSSLRPSEFHGLAASPVFSQSRACPLEMFTTYSEISITDDVGPRWLDHRGPPGARACSRPWTLCSSRGPSHRRELLQDNLFMEAGLSTTTVAAPVARFSVCRLVWARSLNADCVLLCGSRSSWN